MYKNSFKEFDIYTNMVFTANGLSRNIDISFSNVRKDLSELKDKFQLLELKVEAIKMQDAEAKAHVFWIRQSIKGAKKISTVKGKANIIDVIKGSFSKNEELGFYDLKTKSSFNTTDYKEVVKDKTVFAVAKSPSGEHDCYRILRKAWFKKFVVPGHVINIKY